MGGQKAVRFTLVYLNYVYFRKIGWPLNNAVNQITEHTEHVIQGDSANLFNSSLFVEVKLGMLL